MSEAPTEWGFGDAFWPEDAPWSDGVGEPFGRGPRRSKRRRAVATIGTLLVVAALIFAVLPTDAPALPPRAQFGPPGPAFSMSIPGTVREQTIVHRAPVHVVQYGATLLERFIWNNGTRDAVQVNVWVDELASPPPATRLNPFLRSYLPTTHGGRIVQEFGLPAAVATVPCEPFTGAPGCRGTDSDLTVLDGRTLYSVDVRGPGSTVRAVLATFRA